MQALLSFSCGVKPCAFAGHASSLVAQFISMQLENASMEDAKADKETTQGRFKLHDYTYSHKV